VHVAVTGSSGLIGSACVTYLTDNGHRVTQLVRRPPKPGVDAVQWEPSTGFIEPRGLDGVDAIVHLAGENIASGRWSARKKADIRDSRVTATRRLCETLAQRSILLQTFVCASAVGYYGHRGDEPLTEESPSGSGFLAEVCREWERAAEPALQRGLRVVHLRFGVVLSPSGGALAKLLPLFRLGLGGPLGRGTQQMGWIALDDVLGIVQHVLRSASLRGPVNAVAPNPVTNREFTRILGLVLRRPAVIPAPAFALKLLLGHMAEEALLAGAKVVPAKLLASSYPFRYPSLEGALRHLLGR
jgi:uncharacterized protein (TIGR01777 family)